MGGGDQRKSITLFFLKKEDGVHEFQQVIECKIGEVLQV